MEDLLIVNKYIHYVYRRARYCRDTLAEIVGFVASADECFVSIAGAVLNVLLFHCHGFHSPDHSAFDYFRNTSKLLFT